MASYHVDMGRKPVPMKNRPPFGAHLHKLRVAAGLTQAELANRLGIQQASVAHWELRGSKPHVDFLPKLAAIFRVSVDEILLSKPSEKRKPGPVGKLQLLFEEASSLPRSKQEKVVTVLEAVLLGLRSDEAA